MNKMMQLDPSEFGGAAAHVAAAQVFEFLTNSESELGEPGRTWYGSDDDSGEAIQDDILGLARYVNGRNIPGEQIWRKGVIDEIVTTGIPETGLFADLPLSRRMAFNMFATICAAAHQQLDLVQIETRKAEADAIAAEAHQGLRLKDSIFEPHGSLSEQDPHQKQFLEDRKAADAQLLEEQAAEPERPPEAPQTSAGAPIDDAQADPEKPASISAGIQEGTADEKEVADQGQASGGEAPADPDAQGDVSALSDHEPAAGDGQGGADSQPGQQASEADKAPEVDAALAEPGAGEGDGKADDDAVASQQPVKKQGKTKNRKSTN